MDLCGASVPQDIQDVYEESFQKQAWKQLQQLGEWLSVSLQQSIATLSKTSSLRAKAWKQAVLEEHSQAQAPHHSHSTRSTPAFASTNGVLTDFAELHASARQRKVQLLNKVRC